MKKKTLDDFIYKSNKVHNNFYSYDKSTYTGIDDKIVITCPVHGDFHQKPYNHMVGHGCKKCASSRSNEDINIVKDDFIKKCLLKYRNGEYLYDDIIFTNYKTKTDFLCTSHGKFSQTPENHINHGCTKCSHEKRLLKTLKDRRDEFILMSSIKHNSFYDYKNITYKNTKEPVEIICPEHGPFFQRPDNHLSGKGCQKCKCYSKYELHIKLLLESKNIDYEYQKTYIDFKNQTTNYPYRFDFFLPKYNLIIEYDGEHHYKPIELWGGEEYFQKIKNNDKIKNEYCLENNIELLRISYKEKNNISEIINKKLIS